MSNSQTSSDKYFKSIALIKKLINLNNLKSINYSNKFPLNIHELLGCQILFELGRYFNQNVYKLLVHLTYFTLGKCSN